jgi:hypothetical protein
MADTRTDIVIRRASASDARALWRLAALDSAPAPLAGPDVLVAEVAGELVAALAGDRAVADPFRPTGSLVDLLRLRAVQIDAAAPAVRSHRRTFAARPVPLQG